jgi:monovalent cation/proton antiporter MnhG/PhaG subunit
MISDIIIAFLILTGSLVALISSLGLFRFKDVYSRMHAVTKVSSVAMILFFVALILDDFSVGSVIKSLLSMFFLIIFTPVAAHVLSKVAMMLKIDYSKIQRVWKNEKDGENAEHESEGERFE